MNFLTGNTKFNTFLARKKETKVTSNSAANWEMAVALSAK
jgi:hypothetical protein